MDKNFLNTKIQGGKMTFFHSNWFKIILGLIFILILFLISYYVYKSFTKKYTYTPNKENELIKDTKDYKNAQIILWYANWCPHCKASKPSWDIIKEKYDNKNVNGYLLEFIEVDCTQETPEVESSMNKYNIEGFPTIKIIKDGTEINFDAKPTEQSLDQFINSVL